MKHVSLVSLICLFWYTSILLLQQCSLNPFKLNQQDMFYSVGVQRSVCMKGTASVGGWGSGSAERKQLR